MEHTVTSSRPVYTVEQRRELFQEWSTCYQEAATFLSIVKSGRFRTAGLLGNRLNLPEWNGEVDKKLLIEINQVTGLGDVIQYIRFVPALAERQTKPVTVACQQILIPLLSRCLSNVRFFDVQRVEDFNSQSFERRVGVYEMPGKFHPWQRDFIPSEPYISADPARVTAYVSQVDKRKLKVGLVWAAQYSSCNYKSFPLTYFRPLAEIPDVQLISLQKGPPEADLDAEDIPILRPLTGPPNAEETAALIACCDLVVSVDSFPVHLAGAMGLPVFNVLSDQPCTRWLNSHPSRTFTSWYPTMRLYHPRSVGEWPPVNGQPAFSGMGRNAVRAAGLDDLQQRLVRDVGELAAGRLDNVFRCGVPASY